MLNQFSPEVQFLSKGFFNHCIQSIERKSHLAFLIKKRVEHVIMFGGRTPNKLLPNHTFLLKVSATKCSFERLQTQGAGPSSRYNHTLTFFEKSDLVCVYGGQSHDSESSSKNSNIFLLSLSTLVWQSCEIMCKNQVFKEIRYCHSAVAYKDKLVILGGIGANGFVPCHIHVLTINESFSFTIHDQPTPPTEARGADRGTATKPRVGSPEGPRKSRRVEASPQKHHHADPADKSKPVTSFAPLPIIRQQDEVLGKSPKQSSSRWNKLLFDNVDPKIYL